MTDQMREHETNQARTEQAQAHHFAGGRRGGPRHGPAADPGRCHRPPAGAQLVLFPGIVLPLSLGRVRPSRPPRRRRAPSARSASSLQRDPAGGPGSGPAVRDRYGRRHPALCHRPGWRASPGLPGRAALPDPRVSAELSVPGRAHRPHRGAGDDQPRVEARLAHLKQRTRRGPAVPAAGAARACRRDPGDPDAGRRRRSGGELHGPQGRGEAGDPRDDRRQGAARQGPADAEPRDRGPAPDARHQRADQGERRQPPARVHPARADEDHPAPARRGGRDPRRARRARPGDHQGEDARRGRSRRRARS